MSWEVFNVDSVTADIGDTSTVYREFLRSDALSCGIYRLAKGATDMQTPHDDDEVYYVIKGRARMKVGEEEQDVGPGSILYIGAASEHSFFEIHEDMELLVFFAHTGR